MNEQEVSAIVDAIRSRKPNGEFYLTERSCISAITTMKSLEPKVEEIAKIIEEKVWERHEGCIINKSAYKECPEDCCYLNCATAIVNHLKGR